jgi:glycosyltransferase involved in cell wall biosynthesis
MNRPQELAACLASVFSGSALPGEILVSDDSTDQSARWVAEQYSVRYQVGPRRGLGRNRNACIDAVRTSHIAFIDDDVIVSPGFIARAGEVAGDDVVTGYEVRYMHSPHKVVPHNADFLGFQTVPVKNGEYSSIVINATVFPNRLFQSARFDEFIRYGYEEIDMARQARALGLAIRQDGNLWVEHHPSPINRDAYAKTLTAARLYLTFRAYWRYERNVLKALTYAVVAPIHEVLSAVKHDAGLSSTVRGLRCAASYVLADAAVEGYAPRWSKESTS